MKQVRIRKRSGKKGQSYQVIGPCPKTAKEIIYGTFRRKHEADAKVVEVTAGTFNLTEFGKRQSRTVADLVNAFLKDCQTRVEWTISHNAWHERQSMSQSTMCGYQSAAKYILLHLGDINLTALDLDDLQKMVKAIEYEGVPASARRAGDSIKTMLRWGAKREWTVKPRLIALLDQILQPPKRRREVIGTEDHYRAIFKVIFGPRRHKQSRRGYLIERVLWTILISNGPRRGEASQIRIEDIDWVTGCARIKNSFDHAMGREKSATKTKAGERPIWFAKQTLDAARHLLELSGNSTEGLLFEPTTGKSIYGGMYAAYLLPVLKAAGIPREESRGVINFHSTRHRSTSEHHKLGVPVAARKALLGHSRTGGDMMGGGRGDVTDVYTHMLPEDTANRRAVQEIVDYYMPDQIDIEPIEQAMKLRVSESNWHNWDPEKKRAYHREYMRKRRAAERAAAAQADRTGSPVAGK